MGDIDEQSLFESARAGDRGAFDALQDRLQPSVLRFVMRLIGQRGLECDIVQEAFLSLYLNLDKVRSPQHFRPYLFRIVRNLCYDELRRRGRFQHVSLDADDMTDTVPIVDTDDMPDQVAQWALVYAKVRRQMNALPELQRQALILYAEEDLTYAQTAEAMGTDIGTIKSRIHNARGNLVKRLAPDILSALGVGKEAEDD